MSLPEYTELGLKENNFIFMMEFRAGPRMFSMQELSEYVDLEINYVQFVNLEAGKPGSGSGGPPKCKKKFKKI